MMIATCVHLRSSELADHQRGRFIDEQVFPLTVGKQYVVVALGIWETILQVLVRDDNGLPSWCPIGLFDISHQILPSGWAFGVYDGITASGRALWTRWVARWGYDELINNPTHSDALPERDPAALEIFDREVRRLESLA